MIEEQLGFGTGTERRRASRITTNQAVLCLTLGLAEGGFAALAVILSAVVYHVVFAGLAFVDAPMDFYLAYGLVAGGSMACFPQSRPRGSSARPAART